MLIIFLVIARAQSIYGEVYELFFPESAARYFQLLYLRKFNFKNTLLKFAVISAYSLHILCK